MDENAKCIMKDFKDAIELIKKISKEGFYNNNLPHEEAIENGYYKIIDNCSDFLEDRGI